MNDLRHAPLQKNVIEKLVLQTLIQGKKILRTDGNREGPICSAPFGSNNYFAVCSINMHDIYFNTRFIFIDTSIVKLDKGIDM